MTKAIEWKKPESKYFTFRESKCGRYCIMKQTVLKNGKQDYEYMPMIRSGARWRTAGFASFEDAAGFLNG